MLQTTLLATGQAKTLSPELLEGCTVWMVGSVQEEDCDGLCWQYILREEVFLEEIFGQAYLDYKQRVRRWL